MQRIPKKMLILASESPRRRELLGQICEKFEICSADIKEVSAGTDPFFVPEHNAVLKAADVAARHPGALVIGADTVIIFENRVIGKPRDLTDAEEILAGFSGKEHFVVTGVALKRVGENPVEISYIEKSVVKFKKIDTAVIRSYLARVNVLDKAGAYALQEYGNMIIESCSGESENVVGLPLIRLKNLLSRYN